MKSFRYFYLIFIFLSISCFAQNYSWLSAYDSTVSIKNTIVLPSEFKRFDTSKNGFGKWLQGLPLYPADRKVYLHDGSLKANQFAQHAVLQIDPGKQDLQQCADAVMRLRAEYLYSKGLHKQIHFNYTNGDLIPFTRWIEGERPIVRGNKVFWNNMGVQDASYSSFRRYLKKIFTYAGTASLSKELKKVHQLSEIQMGDVFIQGGFPGHAVLVVDVAVNETTGEIIFLLAQSYMPAQDIHILKNPNNQKLSPWYSINFSKTLNTPEWTFKATDLKRF